MAMFALAAAVLAATTSPAFVAKPCADQRLINMARCGSVLVPEDRTKANGRRIALNIIVMPATGSGPRLTPLFDIDGGPGLPVTKNVAFYATAGSAYRQDRDIVLVDQRGTGGSNPLHCPALSKPELSYQPLYPVEAVRDCRKELEGKADLARYGTADAVADLDAVRSALGYEQIDLFGLSYGSTVALRYLATYPRQVRAAVLMGVAPASTLPPKEHALAGTRAMRLLFDQCEQDVNCGARFDPVADLEQARRRLPSIAGAPSEEIFFEKLRSLMYQPTGSRKIPSILSRAAAGDLEPFFAATKPNGTFRYAEGMFMSVVCSEGIGLMDVAAARAASKNTVLGDYRLRQQEKACSEWVTAKVPGDHLTPVRSDAGVLLVSGELDPVTPPDLAEEVRKTLPNSRHIIIPSSGHVFDGMTAVDTCLDPLILGFLASGDPKTIKTDCVSAMRPPPFTTGPFSPGTE